MITKRNLFEVLKKRPLNIKPSAPIIKRKKGGNIIVSGVLHSRKNKVKDNELLKDAFITVKGIPVVEEVCDTGGCEITQHAEVEKNEIIFNIEVTNTIEGYKEAYEQEKSEETLIKLGKYVALQLRENTTDSKDKLLTKK